MKVRKAILIAGYIIAVGLVSNYLVSCRKQSLAGLVVFTRVPIDNFDIHNGEITQKYPKAQIVAVNPDEQDGSEIILTNAFYSACSPEISYDAKKMLFIAQKNENDSWQVWEMNLKKRSSKKITDFEESCFGPAYLPGDRLVFSRQMTDTDTGAVQALFTMNLDGSNLDQITFQPHYDYPATILRDGRILMLSQQLYPGTGDIMYLAMRPNGTKAELFYKGMDKSVLNNQANETADGIIYFIEWVQGKHKKGDIVSVHQNRPQFTKVNYTSELSGGFYAVLPTREGEMIVSYRPSDTGTIALYRFCTDNKSLCETVYDHSDYHVLEPALVEAYSRPRNLPDEVDEKESTGFLFCQNISITSIQHDAPLADLAKATSVEVLGIDKSLGIVPVEKDGSFYLKIIANTPFRLQTLDHNDQILIGPSAWIWLRPFERRGCVGCHEDPELAPENLVPLSVKKQPISIPFEGIHEPEPGSTVITAE